MPVTINWPEKGHTIPLLKFNALKLHTLVNPVILEVVQKEVIYLVVRIEVDTLPFDHDCLEKNTKALLQLHPLDKHYMHVFFPQKTAVFKEIKDSTTVTLS